MPRGFKHPLSDDELVREALRLGVQSARTLRRHFAIGIRRSERVMLRVQELRAPAVSAAPGGGVDDPHRQAPPPASTADPPPVKCRVALSLMAHGVPRAEALIQAGMYRNRHAGTVPQRGV